MSAVQYISGTIMMLILILIGVVVFIRVSRRHARDGHWVLLSRHANKRGLRAEQMTVLRSFFYDLDREDSEQVLLNPRRLRALLYRHLESHREIDGDLKVQLMDRLFAEKVYDEAITDVLDLHVGEIGHVSYGREDHLARIMGSKEKSVVLSVPAEKGEGPAPGGDATLYLFRAAGGYRMHGRVTRRWQGGLSFEFNGQVEHFGEEHLMTQLALPVVFEAWGPPGILDDEVIAGDSKLTGMPATESDSETPPNDGAAVEKPERTDEPVHLELHGTTERISDRAFTFVPEHQLATMARTLKQQQLWRTTLQLPGGFVFNCEGRISAYRAKRGITFVFRYIDITENAHRILFSVIKEQGAEREHLL
ncbi:MAG: hypothetical protein KDK35_13465 [Leptospiraceae bacterium]|nr:hypothetical protein [Leptospiraceae bacterium]